MPVDCLRWTPSSAARLVTASPPSLQQSRRLLRYLIGRAYPPLNLPLQQLQSANASLRPMRRGNTLENLKDPSLSALGQSRT
ncbi:hypothetical protein RAB80_017928 [Fusarium oxysporum f. sp. vasinfectum]|nr:hypothetical protein RAB80_017928 [Fusarium oxysporum f. sp. vasinfectum]